MGSQRQVRQLLTVHDGRDRHHLHDARLVNPKLKGPVLEPNKAGVVTFRGFRFNSSEGTVYRTK